MLSSVRHWIADLRSWWHWWRNPMRLRVGQIIWLDDEEVRVTSVEGWKPQRITVVPSDAE